MKRIVRFAAVCLIVCLFSACAGPSTAPTPTSTPVPTSTPRPTATPEPSATPTLEPSPTRLPPSATPTAPGLPDPIGTPAAEWNGLPVMPGALAGQDNTDSYIYTTLAAPEEVAGYYETALPPLGWDLLAGGQGETGAILLIFTQGAQTATISILIQPSGETLVMMLK